MPRLSASRRELGDDAAAVAADFKGLGVMEVSLNYLGEAAESHACDGSVESSAWQLRDGTAAQSDTAHSRRRPPTRHH